MSLIGDQEPTRLSETGMGGREANFNGNTVRQSSRSYLGKQGCAFPRSPGVAGCVPGPHGLSAGLGSPCSGLHSPSTLMAMLGDAAHAPSEITLKAEKAYPALSVASLYHNVVARLGGE